MQTLSSHAFRFNDNTLNESRRLLSERKIWKIADRRAGRNTAPAIPESIVPMGFAGGLVLDKEREPHKVLWNASTWQCDCSDGQTQQPCSHLGALLLALEILQDTPSPKKNVENDENLDPQQHMLFFSEPEPVIRHSVVLFGPATDVHQALMHPTRRNIPLGWIYQDMMREEWRIAPAIVVQRPDGSTSLPCGLSPSDALSSHLDSSGGEGKITAFDATELLAELMGEGWSIVNSQGRKWTVQESGHLHLRFEPLLTARGDQPRFIPQVSIDTDTISCDRGITAGNKGIFATDPDAGIMARTPHVGSEMSFLRLILSRRVLSTADIRAWLSESKTHEEKIVVEHPDLPEFLPLLTPCLVLDIIDRGEWTDFKPLFQYGQALLSPSTTADVVTENLPKGRIRQIGRRNMEAEQNLIQETESILTGVLSWTRGHYYLPSAEDTPLRLELPLMEVLNTYGSVLLSKGVKIRLENKPVRIDGTMQFHARHENQTLTIEAGVTFSDADAANLDLDAWVDRGLVKTPQGYFAVTDKDLEQLAFLRKHGMDNGGFLSTSPDNLSLIDAIYSRIESNESTLGELKDKRAAHLSIAEFDASKTPLPPQGFCGKLRKYQFHGYAWLLHLHSLKIGACLADDMGLGKTVQTLACLCRLKSNGQLGPSLLVGPVVTIANWIAETRRFAPGIEVHHYTGPPEKRHIPASNTDIVLVSYQTLRNDAERFLDREWDYIILDEAHYIKNAASRTFKTVRSLNAKYRISLTGTPLENHLGELWSLMSFLNPGLLGGLADFKRLYSRPVERDGDAEALERLNRIVAPFILRRKKQDVLDDLPPKDESIIRCEMTADQAEVYTSMHNLYYQQITGLLNNTGLDGSRIEIFTILSKLRLLAIHPPLAGDHFAGISSGKMAALDILLDEILEEDHKVLVFSQFLGALDRAEQTCVERCWNYSRLTGSTKKRETPIARFQNDPMVKVFLLSLRAGGVGINLTAADYVVLLDPWWNPSVEAQAIDRAHRMGQQRPVMAYKMITTGTIEEKVLEMQERKKSLVAGVLGDSSPANFSEEDILNLFSKDTTQPEKG